MQKRLIGSITKLALEATAFVVAGTITAKVAGNVFSHRLLVPPTHQIPDYDAAMTKIAHIQVFEKTLPLQDVCHTKVLTHGHKVEQAIILMHGMTSCPRQFINSAPSSSSKATMFSSHVCLITGIQI